MPFWTFAVKSAGYAEDARGVRGQFEHAAVEVERSDPRRQRFHCGLLKPELGVSRVQLEGAGLPTRIVVKPSGVVPRATTTAVRRSSARRCLPGRGRASRLLAGTCRRTRPCSGAAAIADAVPTPFAAAEALTRPPATVKVAAGLTSEVAALRVKPPVVTTLVLNMAAFEVVGIDRNRIAAGEDQHPLPLVIRRKVPLVMLPSISSVPELFWT